MAEVATLAATPGLPVLPKVDFSKLYYLQYIESRKTSSHIITRWFLFDGVFKDAIMRGKLHCERLGLRFLIVRPFLTDLAMEEQRINDGEGF